MAKQKYEVLQKYATTGMAPHEIRALHGKDNQNFAVISQVFPNIRIKLEDDRFDISSIGAANDDDAKNALFVKSTFIALQRGYTAKKKMLTPEDIITTAKKVAEGDKKYIDSMIGASEPKKEKPAATFEVVAKSKTDKLPRIDKKLASAKPRSKAKADNKARSQGNNTFSFENNRIANKILTPETIAKIESAFSVKIESKKNAIIGNDSLKITMQAIVTDGMSGQRGQALHVLRDLQKEYVIRESEAFTSVLKNPVEHSKKEVMELNEEELNIIDQSFEVIHTKLKPLRSEGMKSFKEEAQTAREAFIKDCLFQQINAADANDVLRQLYLKYEGVQADNKPDSIGDEIQATLVKLSDFVSAYNEKQTNVHLAAKEHFTNDERGKYGSMIGTTLKEQGIILEESAKKILTHHAFKVIEDVFVETPRINEIVDFYATKGATKIGFGAEAHFTNVLIGTPRMTVRPKNKYQEQFILQLQDEEKSLNLGLGALGTGKTYLSIANAAANFGSLKKLILTRPVVEAGDTIGFLPGDQKEKMDPYMRPYYDALEETLCSAKELEKHIESKKIEIAPLSLMRGRTFKGTAHQPVLMLLDEAQNCTHAQIKLFTGRIGENCHVVITGDITQTDLPTHQRNGLPLHPNQRPGLPLLLRAMEMKKDNAVAITTFPLDAVERSHLASYTANAYAMLDEELEKEYLEELEQLRIDALSGKNARHTPRY